MTTDATPAKVRLTEVLAVTAPVVVSYGAGTNSTAMVCEMVRRGEPIAAVVFADTGGERPATYEHLREFSDWLVARGYPAITTVQQTTKVGDVTVTTLEANILAYNDTYLLTASIATATLVWILWRLLRLRITARMALKNATGNK